MKNNFTIKPIFAETFSNLKLNRDGLIDHYTSIADEYESLLHGVGIRDISFFNKLFIHGKKSLELLNRLSTNSVNDLNELEWKGTVFTNNEGNIIDRTILLRFEDYLLVIGSGTEKNKLLKWIDRFTLHDDITVTDALTDYNLFEIIGPESGSYISMILGDKHAQIQDNKIIRAQIENYFIHSVKCVDNTSCDKYIILVESKYANDFCGYLLKNTSAFNLSFVGEAAYDVFRIERGVPIVPNELNDNFNPCEANLTDEIDQEKKGYIGCEQVKNSPSHRSSESKLSGILFGEKLHDDTLNLTIHDESGVQVGVVTSINSSEIIENSLGIGYVDSDIDQSELFAINGNSKFKITISDFPIKR